MRALPPPHQPIPADAARALELLAARWRDFSDLRTLADIRIDRGGERQALTGVLLAKAPASVRFEALSPMGQPLLLVTIHDGRLTSYNVAANAAVLGPATADTAARLLHLPFDPDDLVGVLAARPAPPKDLRVAELLPPDEHGSSLEVIGGIHRQRIWMDFETGVVRQLQIVGGRFEVRVTYLLDADGRPAGFDLTGGQAAVTSSVRYRDPAFDAGIDPERFHFSVPETAKIQQLR